MLLFGTRGVEEELSCHCFGYFCASAKVNYIESILEAHSARWP